MLLDNEGQPQTEAVPAPRKARNYTTLRDRFDGALRNPDRIRIDDYERMVDTDETVASAIEFIQLSVCSYLGEYYHPSSRIQRFVRRQWVEMRGSLVEAVEEILSALWAGFSVTEKVFIERRGQVVLDELVTLPPKGVRFQLDNDRNSRNHGQILVAHQRFRDHDHVPLEAGRFLHYAHRGRFKNPYGKSRLKAAWKNWFLKDVLLKAWGMTLERYGSPMAVGKTSNPTGKVSVGGAEMERQAYLLTVLENLQNSSVLVLNEDEAVDIVQVERAFGADFEACQNHLNRMIYRALLVPSLVFDSGDGVGSYAMASKHFEVYLRAIKRLVRDMHAILVGDLIRSLVDINFGQRSDGDYGEFRSQMLEEEDLKLWAEIFFPMINAGVLSTREVDDLNQMRSKLGFEPRNEPFPETEGPQESGRDGLPGMAPDGLDDATTGTPQPTPRVEEQPQGRPEEDP